ncbi:acyltransferase [Opitutales bacterium]|nr:acyltransferase [Opitutales bacterium]
MPKQSPRRDFAPDLIKTCAILGVICIHCRQLVNDDVTRYLDWVARSAVPTFIILWAVYTERALLSGKKIIPYLSKRLTHIFLVFAIWSVFYLLLKETWSMPTMQSWLVRHFSGGAWAGQYFFIVLIQLILTYPLIRVTYNNKQLRLIILGLCIILYLMMGYGYNVFPDWIHRLKFRPFLYCIPYVYLGIAIARNKVPKIHPLWALFGLVLIASEFWILEQLHLSHSAYITPGVLFGSMIFTVGLWHLEIPKLHFCYLQNVVTHIGKNTMTLFVANPLIILLLSKLYLWDTICGNFSVGNILLTLLLAQLIAGLCLILAFCIRKVRLNGILN